MDPEKLDAVYDEKTQEFVGFGTCNTAMCFAGWATTLRDVKLAWALDRSAGVDDGVPEGMLLLDCNYTQDGQTIQNAAMDLLGIESPSQDELVECFKKVDEDEDYEHPTWDLDAEAPHLFNYQASIEELYEHVALLADLDPVVLVKMVNEEISDIKRDQQERRDMLCSLADELDLHRGKEVVKN